MNPNVIVELLCRCLKVYYLLTKTDRQKNHLKATEGRERQISHLDKQEQKKNKIVHFLLRTDKRKYYSKRPGLSFVRWISFRRRCAIQGSKNSRGNGRARADRVEVCN